MIQCEQCGKAMRTTQGLRGHKTFVHGLYANHDKPAAELRFRQRIAENRSRVNFERSSTSEYRDRLDKLESEFISNTKLLTELRRTVNELQNKLALMATRSEIHRIDTIVEKLGKRLDEHDRWFNPHDTDEIILCLLGGPIATLEKRLDNLELITKPGRRG